MLMLMQTARWWHLVIQNLFFSRPACDAVVANLPSKAAVPLKAMLFLPDTPAVTSGDTAVYQCPQPSSGWQVGAFYLQTFASGGPACCSSQGLSTPAMIAVVARDPQGSVTVTPVPADGAFSTCSTAESVDVAFEVSTTTSGLINVPTNTTALDGRVCTSLNETTTNRECHSVPSRSLRGPYMHSR
jgi:hypothetical protein